MQIKKELRKKFKKLRNNLIDKEVKDELICSNFLNSDLYKNSEQILCYSSLNSEIETDKIINKAFCDNKKVALPVCEDLNGIMNFYYVGSFNDIKIGAFGIKEPDVLKCKKVIDFNGALCVVPAFSFDENGYRLGYGKGYYDRFLEKCALISAGLCYNEFLSSSLPVDKYDKNVMYIFTEDKIIDTERGILYGG